MSVPRDLISRIKGPEECVRRVLEWAVIPAEPVKGPFHALIVCEEDDRTRFIDCWPGEACKVGVNVSELSFRMGISKGAVISAAIMAANEVLRRHLRRMVVGRAKLDPARCVVYEVEWDEKAEEVEFCGGDVIVRAPFSEYLRLVNEFLGVHREVAETVDIDVDRVILRPTRIGDLPVDDLEFEG